MQRLLCCVVPCFVAVACSTRPSEPPRSPAPPVAIAPPAAPAPEPSTTPVAPAPPAKPRPARIDPKPLSFDAPPELDAPSRPVGTPCSPSAGASGLQTCGKRGKVSIELDAHTIALLRAGGCAPYQLAQSTPYRLLACVSEGVLYVAADCFACRMMDAGWSLRAVIADLGKQQVLELMRRLGLDGPRLISTEAEWDAALSAARHETPEQPD